MRKPLFAMLLGCAVCAAHADNFVYVGAGVSKARLSDITTSGVEFSDIHNTSWKVLAGFRPISLVAVEADYLELGSQSGTFISNNGSGETDAKAFAVYGVGFLPNPVPFLDLFGKAGLSRWQLSVDGTRNVPQTGLAQLVSLSKRGTGFAWGAGAGVHLGNIGARLEYESFNIPNTSGARIISLSAVIGFF
jgi:opacity protein-like surface antigen